ncbi:MAG: 5'-methylthioadenosine/adenosylhomocysteine nucleosidase [Bacteroides sp.]|nr:5'-methylthioadenosine/adenosylhomocysteine nucleosidase [Bacteroides sp.]MCM1379648.1 5'-methylthioadenosine/adenosylhomocysteine nucleosidase [Bacteroides sp.]MCM1445970.1 5'-methylthioadenosine/adenosylhomocysteine nucleosidase [Prevotella sp.]
MTIGIIVAMEKELALLLPLIENREERTADGFTMHYGNIGPNHVCAMTCGIGKVNAALGTLAMIHEAHPDLIINTGVAGGTGVVRVLDVAVATAVGYHDVYCGPDCSYGRVLGCPAVFTPDEQLVGRLAAGNYPNVKFGTIASGDIFVDSRSTVDKVLGLYPDAVGVDMESGAIAQTCWRFGVPFVIIRVISDTPGEVSDNTAQYFSFWDEAPRETFAIVKQLISEL